jgi:hypothetical protein
LFSGRLDKVGRGLLGRNKAERKNYNQKKTPKEIESERNRA